MKKITLFTCVPSVVLALTFSAATYAQEQQAINDRDTYIANLVDSWKAKRTFADGWQAEFTEALQNASDEQLRLIQDADNYQHVGAILQGRTVPVTIDGIVGMDALGDLDADLTYTPVVPCRFFDTRFDNISGPGHTTGSTPTTHAYQVRGSAATLVHQGYNKGVNSGAGCPAPNGEPVGIAANFTAAGPQGNGNIRVWPYGGSLPNVSLVNYTTGTNIANAGIIATGYLEADDINVTMQYGTVDALGDVTGYFYPADIQGLSNTRMSGDSATTAFAISPSNPQVFIEPADGNTILNFNGGEEVLWWVSTSIGLAGSAGSPGLPLTGNMTACYRDTSTLAVTCLSPKSNANICFSSTGLDDTRTYQTAGHVANMPAGQYEFGFTVFWGANCGATPFPFYVTDMKITALKLKN